jgi:hypothetical protein
MFAKEATHLVTLLAVNRKEKKMEGSDFFLEKELLRLIE